MIASRFAPIISTPYSVEHARVGKRDREIQRRLPADCRQQRVGTFAPDDCRNGFDGERLDVGDVGGFRIGHDRRRIGVDQHDLVTLLPQRFAGLRSGIIKLAGLTDDDRTRADDQNFVDVSAFGHLSESPVSSSPVVLSVYHHVGTHFIKTAAQVDK